MEPIIDYKKYWNNSIIDNILKTIDNIYKLHPEDIEGLQAELECIRYYISYYEKDWEGFIWDMS